MRQYEELASRLDEFIDERLEEAGRLSDLIWEHPELGNQEHETSRVLCEALSKLGYEVKRPYAGYATAFDARYVNGSAGLPVVCYLAQYDALPEVGHGCGHNMCGPMSILAAGALKKIMAEGGIQGAVRVVGTPAEETTGAKVPMAEAGLFDDCSVVMMSHPTTGPSHIGFNSLAVDPYEFTFIGKAAHAAAAPWEGRNALNGLQLFYHAVDMLRQHVRPEVRMHGIIKDGGVAPNVVPSKASAHFLIRAPWRIYLNEVLEQVFDCARGAALATRTEVSWKKAGNSMDNLLVIPSAESMWKEIMRKEVGEALEEHPSLTGSTDMGAISWRVPTMELLISLCDEILPPHTVDFARAAHGADSWKPMGRAAKGMARAGLRTLMDASLRNSISVDLGRQKLMKP